jgi:hypothetical protein
MAFNNCVARKVSAGKLTQQQAQRILAQYSGAFQQFQQHMGYTQAQIAAAQQVVQATAAAAAERRRVMQLQAAATKLQLDRMATHTNIRGDLDPGQYLIDLVENRRGIGGSTLSGKYEAVKRGFRRELTQAIVTFRSNLIGSARNKTTMMNVVREAFGEATGDKDAAAIARAWSGVAEKARTRFNAAGGHVGKLARWAMPQSHDTLKVRKAGRDAWKAAILPRLDLAEMGRLFNNGVAFTDQTIAPLLDEAFAKISTDGYSHRSASARHGSAKYNQRADHRFFTFNSADDWMAYAAEYGTGKDPFRTMLGHLDGMAMDIAMMEELGPNPLNSFAHLNDAAMQLASRSADPRAMDRASGKLNTAADMLDMFTGKTNIPGREGVARGAAALRNYLTSAHLGSAILSSVTDFNTQRIAAGFIGMSKMGFMRQLGRLATSKDMRAAANDAGLIFENAVNLGNAVARYELEDLHVEAAARMADFTIRASGLGWLTEIQRQAFGLEFMNTAAKSWKATAFADLDPRTQRMFKSFGIGDQDWRIIQTAQTHTTSNGLQLLRPEEIEAVGGQGLADRYMEAIASGTEFAIPSTSIRGRSAVLAGTKPGTIPGEMLRFGLQFKAFPVTVMVSQFGRIMAEIYQGRKMNALSYAAGLVVGATVLGALAIQMKDVSKGKDPRDMTTAEFWLAALAQGGGVGLFGDFLFADVNRFGSGIAETLAGPGVSAIDDALRFTVGNIREAALGEDTKIGREFVNLLRNYTPGGSLWYVRAAFEREVLDRLQMLVDPDARGSFRSKERSAEQFGTQYFYGPGSSAISGQGNPRLPDIGNALGG